MSIESKLAETVAELSSKEALEIVKMRLSKHRTSKPLGAATLVGLARGAAAREQNSRRAPCTVRSLL